MVYYTSCHLHVDKLRAMREARGARAGLEDDNTPARRLTKRREDMMCANDLFCYFIFDGDVQGSKNAKSKRGRTKMNMITKDERRCTKA